MPSVLNAPENIKAYIAVGVLERTFQIKFILWASTQLKNKWLQYDPNWCLY